MNNEGLVVAAGFGATILVFATTYEYMKTKKGHTSKNSGLIIVAWLGSIVLLFLANKEYLKLMGY
jgi:hypothetical protein